MKYKALLALTLGFSAAAQAGVYVEMTNRNLATKEARLSQKMYVQGNSGRFVQMAESGQDQTASIIHNDTLYILNDTEKTYVVMDKAAAQKIGQRMEEGMKRMREQMAKMPPEQRAQMEAMMGKQMPGMMGGTAAKVTVEALDTGKNDTVEGRSCRLWNIKRNGELDEQLCVVPYSALPGKENFQAVFASFAKVFDEFAKSVPMLSGMTQEEFALNEKIKGFPVRTRDYEDGKLAPEETVVTVWREESISDATFQIPAGYKKKTMENLTGE